MSKIFISYNPNIEEEQSLALRLQTLSSLYGISILLPDRYGAKSIKPSTKERISEADLFVMFSTSKLSDMVSEEVSWALEKSKKVLIIYDKHKGKNLTTPKGVIEIEFDPYKESPDQVLHNVLTQAGLETQENKLSTSEGSGAIAALLGLGLALVMLAAFANRK